MKKITFILIMLLVFLTGCSVANGNKTEQYMDLISQSRFFREAPEELYIGEAAQDSFSDQGVTVKYLASFNDGEATYLFFDLIDTGANLFNTGSNGFDFSLGKYEFLEKAGYTDSLLYQVVSFNEASRTATICVEHIGPLHNEDISFYIYSMNGNQKRINYTLENVDIYEVLNETQGEFELEEEYRGGRRSISIFDEKTGQSQNIDMPEFDEG
ncbi:MAG: hypothetical protein PHG06_21590 [Parabacteroides sp.]|nr:hypothetical protein [Eubacteriales bacterium]MDD4592987.1 hypothetical protein [Parabacteroides sp.]